MREEAARMGSQCDRLAHAWDRVDRAAAAMVYHCPAGEDLRRLLADRRVRVQRSIVQIQSLQGSILREAADLENRQDEYRRVLRRLTGP
jgi:hypothetical protein